MGGYGSGGSNHNGRPTVDSTFHISISWLKKHSAASSHIEANVSWGDVLKINLKFISDYTLSLSWHDTRIGQSLFQQVNYCKNQRHFGGSQLYFICSDCERKVGKLYLFRSRFACRSCHKLQYYSQRLSAIWRLQSQQQKLVKQLGTEYEWGMSLPVEPKGMKQRKYQRIAKRFTKVSSGKSALDRGVYELGFP